MRWKPVGSTCGRKQRKTALVQVLSLSTGRSGPRSGSRGECPACPLARVFLLARIIALFRAGFCDGGKSPRPGRTGLWRRLFHGQGLGLFPDACASCGTRKSRASASVAPRFFGAGQGSGLQPVSGGRRKDSCSQSAARPACASLKTRRLSGDVTADAESGSAEDRPGLWLAAT